MTEELTENTGELQQKKKPRGKPFKPGQSGNPQGKPKGSKNFSTLFDEAIRVLAKNQELGNKLKRMGIDAKDIEKEMVIRAVIKALGGSYHHFRDLMDRKYGRPKEQIELEIKKKMVVLDE